MPTIEEILRLHRLERLELEAWIEHRWVRPTRSADGGWAFDEVDEARISLICELKDDFQANEDTLGVVLSLMDQLYAARRMLHYVDAAMRDLPEPLRGELRARLKPPPE